MSLRDSQGTVYEIAKPKPEVFEGFIGDRPKILTTRIVERIEYPPEGGILVWYKGIPYPAKYAMIPEAVKATAIVKRGLMAQIKFLVSSPMRYFMALTIFLPNFIWKRIVWSWMENFFDFAKETLNGWYLKPQYMCKSGREIYRVALEVARKDVHLEFVAFFLGAIWEFDNFYRFTSQDILGEINKDSLKKNPEKEIMRLIDIAVRRQGKSRKGKDTFVKIRLAIRIFLWKKWPKELLIEFLSKIDPEKIKLDEADKWFCASRNFNFQDKTFEERMKEWRGIEIKQ